MVTPASRQATSGGPGLRHRRARRPVRRGRDDAQRRGRRLGRGRRARPPTNPSGDGLR